MEMAVWLVFFLVAAVGLTHILVDSPLFQGWKDWFAAKRDKAWKERDALRANAQAAEEGTAGDDPKVLAHAEAGKKLAEEYDRRGRFWSKLVYLSYCYQCEGFWCGLFLGLAFNPIGHGWWERLTYAPLLGFATAFLAPAGAALINFLDIARGGSNE